MPSLTRHLRIFCRPPQGKPVSFKGVSTYTDDGSAITGIFDRPTGVAMGEGGVGGVVAVQPTVQLPFDAFDPMPRAGDTVTVDGTDYRVDAPSSDDDGGIVTYELRSKR